MDAVSRVFAAPTALSLGGRTFRVEPRLARHYAEIADRLLSQRPNPLEVARKNLALFNGSPEIQERLLSIAMAEATRAKSVTWAEMSEYLNSPDGAGFMIWLQIRETSPDMTPEQVRDMLLAEVEDELARLEASGITGPDAESAATDNVINRVREITGRPSGEDELGNSTGPPQTKAGNTTDPSPGGESAGS